LAIVAHYVSNKGELGMSALISVFSSADPAILDELLIDFQELIGAHTGENMAEVVWETIDLYGLKGRVRRS
jgi:hypothetical protein